MGKLEALINASDVQLCFYNGINMIYHYSIPLIESTDKSSENGPSFVGINNNYCTSVYLLIALRITSLPFVIHTDNIYFLFLIN